jgi:hypothetical protein
MIRRTTASASIAVLLALTCNASAQEKKAQPKRAPIEKLSPRPVQPTAPQPPARQAPNLPPQQAGAPNELPPIVYSFWDRLRQGERTARDRSERNRGRAEVAAGAAGEAAEIASRSAMRGQKS